MTILLDNEGFPLQLDTHVSRVKLKPNNTDPILEAWDTIKPKLGTMDQDVHFPRMVPDPSLLIKAETAAEQPPVSYEPWVQRWDMRKPNLGVIELPRFVKPEDGENTPESTL